MRAKKNVARVLQHILLLQFFAELMRSNKYGLLALICGLVEDHLRLAKMLGIGDVTVNCGFYN